MIPLKIVAGNKSVRRVSDSVMVFKQPSMGKTQPRVLSFLKVTVLDLLELSMTSIPVLETFTTGGWREPLWVSSEP